MAGVYEPAHFKVEDAARLHRVIAEHPLGLLITSGGLGILANAIPFVFVPVAGTEGLLRAHVARANPQWQEIAAGAPVLVVFQGVERYISPGLYASKQQDGKVVPTWNYVMVQARGRASVHEDAIWLRAQVEQMTRLREAARAQPWAVGDAPEDFVAAQMRAIVGIEIEITGLRGKFKVSQNRPAQDRASVLAALEKPGTDHDIEMAHLLRAAMSGE